MKRIIRHASLFSGIGAPELAAFWLGWQNLFHCEISEFCNTILNYWYPNSIGYENIKTTDFSEWKGKVDVLTGGFPCQPFSSAGQRLGADDDRYLWPEMLRAIRQIQPSFVIGENVAGILSMVQPCEAVKVGCTTSLFDEGDDIYRKEQQFVVETVCTDLEREGYSVQPFVIPACSVGAPHQRDRVWFLARRNVPSSSADTMYEGVLRGSRVDEGKSEAQRIQERNEIQQSAESGSLFRYASDSACNGDTTQQESEGTEGEGRADHGQPEEWRVASEWSDGLHQFLRNTADTECCRSNEMGDNLQREKPDGFGIDCDGTQWDVADTKCCRCDYGRSDGQKRQDCESSIGSITQGYSKDKFQSRTGEDNTAIADSMRPGLQETRRELEAERIARNIPNDGLVYYSSGNRWQESIDDNGQSESAQEAESREEQLGRTDCPQSWWRNFPTVSPVCRGNDGLPFDISCLTIPFTRWRQEAIKALGNSMVPQVVQELFLAIEREITGE